MSVKRAKAPEALLNSSPLAVLSGKAPRQSALGMGWLGGHLFCRGETVCPCWTRPVPTAVPALIPSEIPTCGRGMFAYYERSCSVKISPL